MRVSEMNRMQIETQAAAADRCVWPIGSTDQHAQLSPWVNMIPAEKIALEAAEPLGLPVFPVMP